MVMGNFTFAFFADSHMDGQTYGQINMWTEVQIDTWTDKETAWQANK